MIHVAVDPLRLPFPSDYVLELYAMHELSKAGVPVTGVFSPKIARGMLTRMSCLEDGMLHFYWCDTEPENWRDS
jgi:hypothetical protein